jgi:hypothetical protein
MVNGVLALDGLHPDVGGAKAGILQQDNLQNYDSVQGDTLFLSSYTTSNSVYVSSGLINLSSLMFLPPEISQTPFSTNIIQGTSNLVGLNSTIFVNGHLSSVGFNKQPQNVSLDIAGTLFTSTFLTSSLLVQAEIQVTSPSSNLWLAFTNTNPLLFTSQNGCNWAPPPVSPPPSPLFGCAYNGNYWIGVGASASATSYPILRSPDGSNWSAISNISINSDYQGRILYGIAWNGQYWVAVGDGSPFSPSVTGILISMDGTTWVESTSGGFNNVVGSSGRVVTWNGFYWLAGGATGGGPTSILKSLDGLTWTPSMAFPPNAPSAVLGITWNGESWFAVGSSSNIIKSQDGSTWTTAATNAFNIFGGSNIVWNGEYFLAGGSAGVIVSFDGSNWGMNLGPPTSALAWNGQYWLAGGSGGLFLSYNGISWSSVLPGFGIDALAYSSNVSPAAQFSNFLLWDNPIGNVLYLQSSPSIAFYPSSMLVNNAFKMDFQTNQFVYPPTETQLQIAPFQMTEGILRTTQTTSTSQIQLGSFFLTIQRV